MSHYRDILDLFKRHGQDHVFADWGGLSPHQQHELLEQCASVDFDWVKERWNEFRSHKAATSDAQPELELAPVTEIPASDAGNAKRRELREAGEELLRQGALAAFLVAGGQGSRLGFAGPKGCFPIGPISGRTLFAWHAEQILAWGKRYGVSIPWYVMTSHENDCDTRHFFEKHHYFGLNSRDLFFFRQDMVPCLDLRGKLMLSSPSTLAMNPNGHGGSFSGLLTSGALDDMRERGVKVVSYFQVDNPLVTICDPVFLGLHLTKKSEMSSKVVEKKSPSERMGVACLRSGATCIIEYMDMDDESKDAVDENGRLRFWAGSIAVHMIDAAFIERIARGPGLPWHQSVKKVARFVDGRLVKPEEENAVKFETFVFDALPNAKNAVAMKVRREHEFAPVKNAVGADSAASCRQMLSRYFCEWLEEAGISIPAPGLPDPATGVTGPLVEISPLYSLDAEELARKIRPDGITLEHALLIG